MPKKYYVHINTGTISPKPHEISAAWVLAQYFKTDVFFEPRSLIKTADLRINGARWELKSPIGNGKRTIQNNLREAAHQSKNIVIDLRRCKLNQDNAIMRIRHEISHSKSLRKVVAILKRGKIIDMTL